MYSFSNSHFQSSGVIKLTVGTLQISGKASRDDYSSFSHVGRCLVTEPALSKHIAWFSLGHFLVACTCILERLRRWRHTFHRGLHMFFSRT